jgi:hypothetical protein
MPSLPAWQKTAITGRNLMIAQQSIHTSRSPETSPLTFSDHLITLAEEADRAGYTSTARRLISLACTVFDEAALRAH